MAHQQPTEAQLDKAHAEHHEAHDHKDAKKRHHWGHKADRTTEGVGDAKHRAETAGDYIEPIVRTPKPDINDPRNIAR